MNKFTELSDFLQQQQDKLKALIDFDMDTDREFCPDESDNPVIFNIDEI